MIAKIKQPGESLERSSSSLVVVVCMCPALLPIQLLMDARPFPMSSLRHLTAGSHPAYSEFMPTQHTFCCCRRSPLACTEAREAR